MRTCTNPIPFNGGQDCLGENAETQNCNTQDCKGKVKYYKYVRTLFNVLFMYHKH